MLLTRNFPELWKFGSREAAIRGTPINIMIRLDGDAAAARYSTMGLGGLLTGYAVPAGKTLIITRFRFRCDTAAKTLAFGYGNNDVGASSAAAPAGIVILTSSGAALRATFIATLADTLYEPESYYEIPTGKYPCIATPTGAWVFHAAAMGHLV